MSKFSFTAPDGQVFDILGPANATIEQARAIFDQQFKSGGLVGLKVGETVSAVTQAEAGLRSALSQLGLKLPTATELAFGSLKNVPLLNPITAVDFIKQATPNFSLGSLKSSDIQGLMSQTAAQLDQSLNTVSASTGIGKFGLDINKLENAGYLKPGTASSYALSAVQAGTQKLESFLSPGAFTGKDGISNLQGILANENVQNTIQSTVLKQSYNLLTATGITQNLSTTRLGGLLQTASTFDVKTAVDFAKGFEVKNISEVLSVAKAGEYATSLVNNVGNIGQIGDITKLAGQLGSINSIADLGKLSGVLGSNLTGLAGQLGNLGGLAGQLGNLGGLAGQLGNLGGLASSFSGAAGIVGGVVGVVSGLFGGRGGSIYAGVRRPQGVSNTVNRDTVNASVTAIIGNEKISTPSFSPRSSDVLAGLQTLKSLSGLANIAEKLRA
jgi:hypothetical protein